MGLTPWLDSITAIKGSDQLLSRWEMEDKDLRNELQALQSSLADPRLRKNKVVKQHLNCFFFFGWGLRRFWWGEIVGHHELAECVYIYI